MLFVGCYKAPHSIRSVPAFDPFLEIFELFLFLLNIFSQLLPVPLAPLLFGFPSIVLLLLSPQTDSGPD